MLKKIHKYKASKRREVSILSVICLFMLISDFVSAIHITSSFPDAHIITEVGSELTLSCASSIPWFFCLWHSPVGNKECAIQESEVRGVCSGDGDDDMYLYGVQDSCSLHIENVTSDAHGDWMCLLNEIQEFDSAKKNVKVNVAVPVQIDIEVIGGGHFNSSVNRLEIMEGEQVEIVCRAKGGFPQPTLSWFNSLKLEPSDIPMKSQSSGQNLRPVSKDLTKEAVIYSSQKSTHLFDGEQSLFYHANLSDSGTNLTCLVIQNWDKSEGAKEIYSQTISLQLEVTEMVLLQSTLMLDKTIGIITGLLLAAIFIILIFILIVIVFSRKREDKLRKYINLDNKLEEDPIRNKISDNIAIVGEERCFGENYEEDKVSIGLLSSSSTDVNDFVKIQKQIKCHKCRSSLSNISVEFQGKMCDNGKEPWRDIENSRKTHIGAPLFNARSSMSATNSISTHSDSSRSSVVTDKSIYIKEATNMNGSSNVVPDRILNVTSSDYHSAPPSQEDSKEYSLFLSSPNTGSDPNSTPPSLFRETHFGAGDSEHPTTVLHRSRPILPAHSCQYMKLGRLYQILARDNLQECQYSTVSLNVLCLLMYTRRK